MIRVLFTGSRYARLDQPGQRLTIWRALVDITEANPDSPITLVHGDAEGADRIAAQAAGFLGWEVEPHPADWDGPCRDTCAPGHRRPNKRRPGDHCPAAGNYRNQAMVDLGADMCVATPGRFSTGTRDCIDWARAAHIPVTVRELPDRVPASAGAR